MSASADSLISAGYQARFENRLKDAREAFLEAVAVCRAAADGPKLAKALTGLGQIERDLGQNARALRHYREAETIIRSLDDPDWLAHTIRHIADILRHEQCADEAQVCYQEALAIYRGRKEAKALDVANAARGFALLQEDRGDKAAAIELWREARDLYQSAGVEAGARQSEQHLRILPQS